MFINILTLCSVSAVEVSPVSSSLISAVSMSPLVPVSGAGKTSTSPILDTGLSTGDSRLEALFTFKQPRRGGGGLCTGAGCSSCCCASLTLSSTGTSTSPLMPRVLAACTRGTSCSSVTLTWPLYM